MKYKPDWGSHFPLLIKTFEMSSGDVVELGMGPFSSPILHWLAFDGDRKLVSYENNREYFDMHKDFKSDLHTVNFVDDWSKIPIEKHWGMAFVDIAPAHLRKDLIARLVNNADFVVVHDTEPESEKWHKYEKVFKFFKYRYDYKKAKPWTSVLSNLYDLNL